MGKLYKKLFFVLGGEDNEMAEIKKVLEKHHLLYWQPQLEWGTIKIEHRDLPSDAKDKHLVFVECRPDWLREVTQPFLNKVEGPLSRGETLTIIDHHNQLSHNPASLTQILKFLNLKPTLRQQIIASIDSDFLAATIAKWPNRKKQIIKIWEDGYSKKFDSPEDYQAFKKYCWDLFKQAVEHQFPNLNLNSIELTLNPSLSKREGFPLSSSEEGVRGSSLLIIEQAPESRTMLAAMANLTGVECCLISGNLDSDNIKPCSYVGKAETVEKLAKKNFTRAYWGKYYLGCRAVPKQFLKTIC